MSVYNLMGLLLITFGSGGNDVVIWSVLVIDIMGAELNPNEKLKKQMD